MNLKEFKKHMYWLLFQQRALCIIAARQCELVTAMHDDLTKTMDIVDQEIKWAIFIEYCNTPCWRYRCD